METPNLQLDYYEILGVNQDATILDIEAAWQKKRREYDLEKLQGFGEKLRTLAEAETEQINAAYEVLKDPKKRKKYDRALAGYTAAPKKQPQGIRLEKFMSKQAEMANDQAIKYWEQNRFDEAINQWEKIARNNPDIAEIHHNLGNAYAHQGRMEEAMESLKQAISIEPNLIEAYNKLGCISYKQGNLDLAVASWNQALKIDPNFQEALHNLRLVQNVTQFDAESEVPAYQHVTTDSRRSRYGGLDLDGEKPTWMDRIRQSFGKLRGDKNAPSE